MPSLFPLPQANTIRVESRLNPAQVDAKLRGDAELNADIQRRISRKATEIELQILGVVTAGVWAARSDEVKALATEITEFRVLDSLFRSARKYDDAREAREEAARIWGILMATLRGLSETSSGSAGLPYSGAVQIETVF